MKLMKAVFVTSFPSLGTVPQNIKVANLPSADSKTLKGTQVLVANKASTVTRDDVYIAQESFAGGFFFLQVPRPTVDCPHVLGCEFAGIVRAVGPGIVSASSSSSSSSSSVALSSPIIQVGDCVCGFNDAPNQGQQGTWAEHVLTDENMLIKFDPKKFTTFAQAASLVLPAAVSTSMIKDAGLDIHMKKSPPSSSSQQQQQQQQQKQQKAPDKIRCLIFGASGAIGSALTTILSRLCSDHVEITGVCSTRSMDKVRACGAHEVYDYTAAGGGSIQNQLEKSGKPRFDVVMDLVGGRDIQEQAMKYLLKPTQNSRFVTCVGPFRDVGSRVLSFQEQTWFGYHLFVWKTLNNLFFRRKQPKYYFTDLRSFSKELFQPVVDANVNPPVGRIVPLELKQVQEALEYVMEATSTPKEGRVILAITPYADEPISSVSSV